MRDIAPFLIGVVLAAGCKKNEGANSGGDCALVTKDPAHAMAELSKKYPNDAVKVAQTIETCVAPTGDECDRIGALVKAIPTMAPTLSATRSAEDYAKTCRNSPPELRKCFLPSYALAHDAECKKMIGDLRSANAGSAIPTTKCDGGSVVAYVSDDGVWLATGNDPAARCFAKRAGTDVDKTWLESELSQFKAKDCKPNVEVAGDKDVKYQDLITVMDVAMKVGLVDVGLTPPEGLAVQFQAATDKSPAHCPATTIAAAAPAPSGARTLAPTAADTVKTAPIIIVTDAIFVRDPTSGSGAATGPGLATVKDVANGTGVIKELADALAPAASADTPIILQANQETPSAVINRIVMTTQSKGYQNVLFAVKNK